MFAKKNYPTTKHIGSVTEVESSTLDKIDLLIGGSPCQGFSFSGRMKGMSTTDSIDILTLEHYLDLKKQNYQFDGQSYLFWEYVRLLNETKPKYFLLENVKMSKKWEEVLTGVLGIEPVMIDSRLVSGQKRRRLYWVGELNENGTYDKVDIKQPDDKNILLKDIMLDTSDTNYNFQKPSQKRLDYIQRKIEKGWLKRSFNDINTEKSECLLATMYKQLQEFIWKDDNGLRFFHINEFERLQTVPINYTEGVSQTQRLRMLGNGWTVDVIAHILSQLEI